MKKQILPACITLALFLTGCGEHTTTGLHTLQKENEILHQQIAELEESCRTLSEENALLNKLNSDLEMNIENNLSSYENQKTNPIDSFFENIEIGSSTSEMNLIANTWANAWKEETYHVAEWLKEQLIRQEDKTLVDTYISTTENQASRLTTMSLYPIADLELPQEERITSSGTLQGVLLAGSYQQLWKDTFYQLIYVAPEYDGTVENGSYTFYFDSGKMQEKINDAITS